MSTKRINLWSGPRNVSTALMYSFARRADTRVVDEPLYAHYLRVSGAEHPGREEVLAAQENDGDKVARELILGPWDRPVAFFKQMAHHLVEIDRGFMKETLNVFLIREPSEVLRSYDLVVHQPRLEDVGIALQHELWDELHDAGQEPPVIDARQLLLDPPGVLAELCSRLGLEFDPAMLSWPAGPRPEDGVWAPHWYANVHRSTGFGPYRPKTDPFPVRLEPVLEECRPHYEALYRHALRATDGAHRGETMPASDHEYGPREYAPEDLPEPRNADLQIWVGDRLWPRREAKVSVFDSVVQGGDAVWEGLRVYDGRVFQLDAHLDRLLASAHAMAFAEVPTRDAVRAALFATLAANGMRDQAHVRLTLTRGTKTTSGMSPVFNRAGCCLIVLAEWKAPVYSVASEKSGGLRLVTSSVRRNSPQTLDSKIHHNNLINNILAKIEANVAGADDALMLDLDGFVSETNATNVFVVRRGEVLTPWADSCLPGITRRVVLDLARANGIPATERRLSLTEVYTADEMLTTGTMGELVAVTEVDGRRIGGVTGVEVPGPVTRRLQELFRQLVAREGTPLP